MWGSGSPRPWGGCSGGSIPPTPTKLKFPGSCSRGFLTFIIINNKEVEDPRLQSNRDDSPQPDHITQYPKHPYKLEIIRMFCLCYSLFSGNEFLKVIRIFLRSLYAFCAGLESFFIYRNPLQVWMLFLFYSRIVVSTEKNPFDSKTADFFANFANHFTATPIRECTLMTRINY